MTPKKPKQTPRGSWPRDKHCWSRHCRRWLGCVFVEFYVLLVSFLRSLQLGFVIMIGWAPFPMWPICFWSGHSDDVAVSMFFLYILPFQYSTVQWLWQSCGLNSCETQIHIPQLWDYECSNTTNYSGRVWFVVTVTCRIFLIATLVVDADQWWQPLISTCWKCIFLLNFCNETNCTTTCCNYVISSAKDVMLLSIFLSVCKQFA